MEHALIREASLRDSAALAELVRQEVELAQQFSEYYELQPDFDWISYARRKLEKGDRMILVAETGDRLVGFIDTRIADYPGKTTSLLTRVRRKRQYRDSAPLKPMSWGIIEGCFVAETSRRQQIGSALVAKAMAWFQNKDIPRVELGALVNNAGAQAFWKELGFETFRTLMQKNINAKNP